MRHVEKKKPCQKNLKKYAYNISQFTAFTPDQLMDVLPKNFSLQEENNQLMLIIESSAQFSEEQIFYELQRECDRIFFLTGEQLKPMLIYKENPDGSKRVGNECGCILHGIEKLPLDIDQQKWQSPLDVQLKLWQLAHLPKLPLSVQVILLFQIIEAVYLNKSNYPDYTNDSIAPDPLTETKLLRDWACHQLKSKMYNDELKRYCKFLGIREEFFDPTNMNHLQILNKRFEVIKNEAEKIINASITRKS